LLSLVLSIVAAQGLLTAQQKPPYDLVRIKAASSESLTVERFGLQPAGENAIPLKGLTFPDMAAVQQQIGRYYFSNYDLRVMLLDEGLARLTDRSTADPKEQAAQDAAAHDFKGIWRDQALRAKVGYEPAAKGVADDLRTRLLGWMKSNWEKLVGTIGTLATLVGLWTFWRPSDVVFAGALSVGKTVLSENLIDRRIYKVGEPESTRGEKKTVIRLRSAGRISYRLNVCDIGGQYPGWLFERLARRRWLLLFRRKMVLVLVLSPYDTTSARGMSPSFVERQYGWTESLIKGFLISKYARRCKGVLIFVNMFDRYSESQSDVNAQLEYVGMFQKHIEVLKSSNLKVHTIVGSGLRGWYCREAWAWITTAICGEVHA